MNGRERRAYVAISIATALLCVAVGTAVAAGPGTTDTQPQTAADVPPPAFVVDLGTDGSADVTVTYTFDLSEDARQAAFAELRNNETAQQDFEDRFRRQLGSVADDTANETGREMSVSAADITFETNDGTGIVKLTATWDGLAATDGDSLTVTEPFASGFQPERPFAVVVPDGYTVDSVSPAPDERADGLLQWPSGTSLDGFELTVSPAEDGTDTPADGGEETGNEQASGDDSGDESDDTPTDGGETPGDDGPGFGLAVGVLALLGVALVALRRR